MSASHSPLSNLSPRETYAMLSNMTAEQADIYKNQSEIAARQVQVHADYFLAIMRLHPYVQVHRENWQNRFHIPENASSLEAIANIYKILQQSLTQMHEQTCKYRPPSPLLKIEALEKCYQQDRQIRCHFFFQHLSILMNQPEFEPIQEHISYIISQPDAPSDLFHDEIKLKEIAAHAAAHGWGDLLWQATAVTNYWEAIAVLLRNNIPHPSQNASKKIIPSQLSEITSTNLLQLAQELGHVEWIQEFHNLTKEPERKKELSIQQNPLLFCDEERQKRVHFFCSQLSFLTLEMSSQTVSDSIGHEIYQYSKSLNDNVLIQKLAKHAAANDWGDTLWRMIASTNYWEAIPFLIEAKIPIPSPDAQEKRTLVEIAEQTNSPEWIEAFAYFSQQSPD